MYLKNDPQIYRQSVKNQIQIPKISAGYVYLLFLSGFDSKGIANCSHKWRPEADQTVDPWSFFRAGWHLAPGGGVAVFKSFEGRWVINLRLGLYAPAVKAQKKNYKSPNGKCVLIKIRSL